QAGISSATSPVEVEVRRHGGVRAAAREGARGRERQAQADVCRAGPRQRRDEGPDRKKTVLLPAGGREAHGRPGRIVVLEATRRGRPWPKWIVCPSWVAGRGIALGIGVRRIGAASPGRCWNWRP